MWDHYKRYAGTRLFRAVDPADPCRTCALGGVTCPLSIITSTPAPGDEGGGIAIATPGPQCLNAYDEAQLSGAAPVAQAYFDKVLSSATKPLQFDNADLRCVSLAQKELRGFSACHARMDKVNATEANLDSAKLVGAELTDAVFTGANLSLADMRGAIATNAYFRNATMEFVVADRAQFTYTKFRGAKLKWASMHGATCESADFSAANMASAALCRADLKYAILSNANLYGANLKMADLTCADLRYADITAASLGGALINDTLLAGAFVWDPASKNRAPLVHDRPILQIGPLGSRNAYLVAMHTELGTYFQTGCFFGAAEQFKRALTVAAIDAREGWYNDVHVKEYKYAMSVARRHRAMQVKIALSKATQQDEG